MGELVGEYRVHLVRPEVVKERIGDHDPPPTGAHNPGQKASAESSPPPAEPWAEKPDRASKRFPGKKEKGGPPPHQGRKENNKNPTRRAPGGPGKGGKKFRAAPRPAEDE